MKRGPYAGRKEKPERGIEGECKRARLPGRKRNAKRKIFDELMRGVDDEKHREGKRRARSYKRMTRFRQWIPVYRETRKRMRCSRAVLRKAADQREDPGEMEQGRAKPNPQRQHWFCWCAGIPTR